MKNENEYQKSAEINQIITDYKREIMLLESDLKIAKISFFVSMAITFLTVIGATIFFKLLS